MFWALGYDRTDDQTPRLTLSFSTPAIFIRKSQREIVLELGRLRAVQKAREAKEVKVTLAVAGYCGTGDGRGDCAACALCRDGFRAPNLSPLA